MYIQIRVWCGGEGGDEGRGDWVVAEEDVAVSKVDAASVYKGTVFAQRRLAQCSGAAKVARVVVKARRRIAFFLLFFCSK